MAVSAVKKEAPKAAAAEAPAGAEPAKSGSKMKLIIIAVAVLALAGGGAFWFLSKGKGDEESAKVEPAKPPQFLPLEPFTVNLLMEENPQFLQVGLTLKVNDAAAIDVIKLHMPELRDKVLMLLSAQKASTLLTVEGKQKLASDIVTSINGIVSPVAAKPAKAAKAAKKKKAEDEEEAAAEDADDAKAEGEKGADEEDEDAPKKAPPKKKGARKGTAEAPGPVQAVLFTSFIIQ